MTASRLCLVAACVLFAVVFVVDVFIPGGMPHAFGWLGLGLALFTAGHLA
jgi:hypothetical protein